MLCRSSCSLNSSRNVLPIELGASTNIDKFSNEYSIMGKVDLSKIKPTSVGGYLKKSLNKKEESEKTDKDN